MRSHARRFIDVEYTIHKATYYCFASSSLAAKTAKTASLTVAALLIFAIKRRKIDAVFTVSACSFVRDGDVRSVRIDVPPSGFGPLHYLEGRLQAGRRYLAGLMEERRREKCYPRQRDSRTRAYVSFGAEAGRHSQWDSASESDDQEAPQETYKELREFFLANSAP